MAKHPDSYLSENQKPERKFIVLIYYAGKNGYVDYHSVEADCYADAVIAVAPGNGAYKIEVIAV